ncbi:hypothetical protein JCM17846_27240 [Iodidimonas nitroreducens]|uniref:Bacteriophage tail tape measure C-terminal domain-containing protein n=1 Tax=Iodidimonas nitroreducens TaxID=1236968 RepID=A0A5A7N9X6_9PROT|nr:phage tail tape measure C-terminal domain-containing protein [Iodidimonas nitroreducens]GER05042.1 hypothetical protein JCM17846_27240 [Iodidimonas nitroreducens]
MTTELDALVVSLRADTRQFRADIAQAQSAMSDLEAMVTLPQDAMGQRLSQLADLSGAIDQSVRSSFSGLDQLLSRFVETGKLSFDDLRSVALSALNDIAQAALQSLLPGGGGGGGGGFGGGGIFSSFLSGVVGLPGRAHGGPVTPNQPIWWVNRGRNCLCRARPGIFVPIARLRGRRRRVAVGGPFPLLSI